MSSGDRGKTRKAKKPSVSSRENGAQQIAVEEGDVRLVLELRGVRGLTANDRAKLMAALWSAFADYLSTELQDRGLCEAVLVAAAD